MKGTSFIQPHSDDTVMSLFYIIKHGFFERPYWLITVFSRSDWVDPTQKIFLSRDIKKFNEKTVTKLRSSEDKIFADKMDMDLVLLDLPDYKIRSGSVNFSPTKKLNQESCILAKNTIADSLLKLEPETIVFPFPNGCRQHPDHRIVYEACIDLENYHRFVHDDFPYSVIAKTSGLKDGFETPIKPLLDKFEFMSIYFSQMNSYFYEQVATLHESINNKERVFEINE